MSKVGWRVVVPTGLPRPVNFTLSRWIPYPLLLVFYLQHLKSLCVIIYAGHQALPSSSDRAGTIQFTRSSTWIGSLLCSSYSSPSYPTFAMKLPPPWGPANFDGPPTRLYTFCKQLYRLFPPAHMSSNRPADANGSGYRPGAHESLKGSRHHYNPPNETRQSSPSRDSSHETPFGLSRAKGLRTRTSS